MGYQAPKLSASAQFQGLYSKKINKPQNQALALDFRACDVNWWVEGVGGQQRSRSPEIEHLHLTLGLVECTGRRQRLRSPKIEH